MRTTFNEFLAGQVQDQEFKAEWEALEPQKAIIQVTIDARKEARRHGHEVITALEKESYAAQMYQAANDADFQSRTASCEKAFEAVDREDIAGA